MNTPNDGGPQLNEWNLPIGTEPHNPDGLKPEQITEGGKWRAVTLDECDGRYEDVCEVWVPSCSKFLLAGAGCYTGYTYRVPITTPLPAVKDSLTPQPATGQSKTPRTDAWIFKTRSEYGPNGPENFTESASYSRKLETKLTAALAQRDEARRLLEEADEAITLLIRHDDIESREHAQALNKALNAQTHITNHLKTA